MKNGFKVIDSDMHIMEPFGRSLQRSWPEAGAGTDARRSQSAHDRRQRAAPEQSNAGA